MFFFFLKVLPRFNHLQLEFVICLSRRYGTLTSFHRVHSLPTIYMASFLELILSPFSLLDRITLSWYIFEALCYLSHEKQRVQADLLGINTAPISLGAPGLAWACSLLLERGCGRRNCQLSCPPLGRQEAWAHESNFQVRPCLCLPFSLLG